MGDEIGILNDHSYRNNPSLADDGRWMHRPFMDWTRPESESGPSALILEGTRHIMAVRKSAPQPASYVPTHVIETGDSRLFAFARPADDSSLTCLFNFTEEEVLISPAKLGMTSGGGAARPSDGRAGPTLGCGDCHRPLCGALAARVRLIIALRRFTPKGRGDR